MRQGRPGLVVVDDPRVRRLVAVARRRGLGVEPVEADRAEAPLRQTRRQLRLVVADLEMPGLGGVELRPATAAQYATRLIRGRAAASLTLGPVFNAHVRSRG